jgi:predicted site-specific integrase-resolvase
MVTTMNNRVPQLTTRKELADALRVSVRTVIRMERRGLLEPVRLSAGCVRYNEESVAQILNKK